MEATELEFIQQEACQKSFKSKLEVMIQKHAESYELSKKDSFIMKLIHFDLKNQFNYQWDLNSGMLEMFIVKYCNNNFEKIRSGLSISKFDLMSANLETGDVLSEFKMPFDLLTLKDVIKQYTVYLVFYCTSKEQFESFVSDELDGTLDANTNPCKHFKFKPAESEDQWPSGSFLNAIWKVYQLTSSSSPNCSRSAYVKLCIEEDQYKCAVVLSSQRAHILTQILAAVRPNQFVIQNKYEYIYQLMLYGESIKDCDLTALCKEIDPNDTLHIMSKIKDEVDSAYSEKNLNSASANVSGSDHLANTKADTISPEKQTAPELDLANDDNINIENNIGNIDKEQHIDDQEDSLAQIQQEIRILEQKAQLISQEMSHKQRQSSNNQNLNQRLNQSDQQQKSNQSLSGQDQFIQEPNHIGNLSSNESIENDNDNGDTQDIEMIQTQAAHPKKDSLVQKSYISQHNQAPSLKSSTHQRNVPQGKANFPTAQQPSSKTSAKQSAQQAKEISSFAQPPNFQVSDLFRCVTSGAKPPSIAVPEEEKKQTESNLGKRKATDLNKSERSIRNEKSEGGQRSQQLQQQQLLQQPLLQQQQHGNQQMIKASYGMRSTTQVINPPQNIGFTKETNQAAVTLDEPNPVQQPLPTQKKSLTKEMQRALSNAKFYDKFKK